MKRPSKTGISLPATLLFILAVVAGLTSCGDSSKRNGVEYREIEVGHCDIEDIVETTGTVEPQNRVEVMPPISGRIDDILVEEGDQVKKSQIIGWLSSTERTALLDAARARGEEELEYWKNAYKPTPLIAPIDGEVIVRGLEPGQSVSASQAVIVLSDRLIMEARVDETDIGRVKAGQEARVTLDAYPDVTVRGKVDHISYESKLVNNVTMYEVDIALDEVPEIFRSGMSAEVIIVASRRDNVIGVPLTAVSYEGAEAYVTARGSRGGKGERVPVKLGARNSMMAEVVSGLAEGDVIVVERRGISFGEEQENGTKNPFMPFPQKKKSKR